MQQTTPLFGQFPTSLFPVHQQTTLFKLRFQVKWTDMHQVETTEGFTHGLNHSELLSPSHA